MDKVKQLVKKSFLYSIIKFFKRFKSKIWGLYYGKSIKKLRNDLVYNKRKLALHNATTYFVIRRSYKGIGLYTYVCIVISYIAYAIEKGFVPIVDMKSYPNIYMSDEMIGKVNAWELFFKQPCGVGLDEISKGRVIFSHCIELPNITPNLQQIKNMPEYTQLFSKIYNDFISYNQETQDYCNKELQLINNKRVLGVLFRGTDYSKGKPSGHPIQPNLNQMIEKVDEYVREYDYKYIYLATEESEAEKCFMEHFPGMILVNNRKYYDDLGIDFSKTSIGNVRFKRNNDEYLKGLEYLSSINILAKCDSLIAGGCAGTYAALIMNNQNYKHTFIWDLGVYK